MKTIDNDKYYLDDAINKLMIIENQIIKIEDEVKNLENDKNSRLEKLKADKEKNMIKIEQLKILKINEKGILREAISKMEDDKTDIYNHIQQIEGEIQNCKTLQSSKRNTVNRTIETDEIDEKYLMIQDKKLKLNRKIDEIKKKKIEIDNQKEMLKEDKLLNDNEIINLISKKETFEEMLKFYQLSPDNENSLLLINNINKSVDLNEIKLEFLACEFKIIDKMKISSFLINYLNEIFSNEILNLKQVQDLINEMFDKFNSTNNSDIDEIILFIVKRLLSLLTSSDKNLLQSIRITTDRLANLIKIVLKVMYYDEIINIKLNFINKEYKAINKEKYNFEAKLNNDLDSLVKKLDNLTKKEEFLKKQLKKKQNDMNENLNKNNFDLSDKLEIKFQSLISYKGEIDVEIALLKERYFDKIEIFDSEINKLEEMNSQLNFIYEEYYTNYDRKRLGKNSEILENKKRVSDYIQIIKELSLHIKNNMDEENLNNKDAINNVKNDKFQDIKIDDLCNELNNEFKHSILNKIENNLKSINNSKIEKDMLKPNPFRRKNLGRSDKSSEKRKRSNDSNINFEPEKDYKEDVKRLITLENSVLLSKQNSIKNFKNTIEDQSLGSNYNNLKTKNFCPRPKKNLKELSPNKKFNSSSNNYNVNEKKDKFETISMMKKTSYKNDISQEEISSLEGKNLNFNSFSNKKTNNFHRNTSSGLDNGEPIIHHVNTNIDKTTYRLDNENIFLDNLINDYQDSDKNIKDGYKNNNSYHLNDLNSNIVKSVYSYKTENSKNSKLTLSKLQDDNATNKTSIISKIKSFSKEKNLKTFEKSKKESSNAKINNDNYKINLIYKLELCSPKEFQFLEKIRIVLEGSFVFKRIKFLSNHEYTEFNPLEENNPINSGFSKFFVFADKTLTKLVFEKSTEPSIKSDINITSIQKVIVTKNMKNIVNYQQLFSKIKKKGIDINIYLSSIKNLEEIDIDYKFILNEKLRKKSESVINYVLYLILGNGIKLELILTSYNDFKHWLNALTSIVKHKNKLSLISNKIEQD